ncbi:MAG: CDP-alcohol phosphatidyltransferase family protein [Gemmatimonadota bacterium]
MLDSDLRPVVDRMLRPAVAALGRRVHPHGITAIGFFVGGACVVALAQRAYTIAFALWLLNRLLDGLDGAVARSSGLQSDLGGYLDLLLDFCLYAIIPIVAVLALPRPESGSAFIALAFLLGSFYINAASWLFLAALLEKAGTAGERPTSLVMPTGIIEGTETIIFFSLIILLPAWTAPLMWTMAGLVLVTAAQRPLWMIRTMR